MENKPDLQEQAPATPPAEEKKDAPPAPKETMGETVEKQAQSFQEKKEHFYDKLNLSYKQIDIIVKILVALVVALLVYGWLTGGSSPFK